MDDRMAGRDLVRGQQHSGLRHLSVVVVTRAVLMMTELAALTRARLRFFRQLVRAGFLSHEALAFWLGGTVVASVLCGMESGIPRLQLLRTLPSPTHNSHMSPGTASCPLLDAISRDSTPARLESPSPCSRFA